MVTVEEMWKGVLPADTRLLAGKDQLGRQVSWVLVLKPRAPGLDAPRGGELILLSTGTLPALDPHLSVARAIHALADKASAVAVRGEVPDEARAEADRLGIPLLELPVSVALAAMEREALRFLSERRSEWYQRKHSILHDLTALAVQGRGLDALAKRMAETTGHAVAFEGEDGQMLAWHLPLGFPEKYLGPARAYADGHAAAEVAPAEGRPVTTYLSDTPVALYDGLFRLAAPVTVKDGRAAIVSMLGPRETLDAHARLVLEAGSTAGAIELAREHAVQETVHRIQGDLVSDLLADVGDRQELERRARRMGHDLEAARVAITFCPVPDGPIGQPVSGSGQPASGSGQPVPGSGHRTLDSGRTSQHDVLPALRRRLARVLTTYEVQPPVHMEDGFLTVFYPLNEDCSAAALKRVAERLSRDLGDAARHHRLYAGISRVHAGIDSFRAAFHEARRALELGRALAPDRPITYFGDLGVYRVLFAVSETGEMQAFYDDMLGRLARYDQEKKTELIPTLDAYLCANNATVVAARLNLHRNSLLYRLRRIREITGLDLDDAETRLALHLALRIGETLRTEVTLGA